MTSVAKHTQSSACDECSKHQPYLKKPDDCVCFATDVMGTFANDATKTTTAKVGKTKAGSSGAGTHSVEEVTSNVGAERLPEGWMWHCRPLSDNDNAQGDKVWQQC